MEVNKEWTDEFMAELDRTIARGNVDKDTIEVMKELLKGVKARVSIAEYFNEQEQ
jgi:hypothetical protein